MERDINGGVPEEQDIVPRDIWELITQDVDYNQELKGKPLCFKSAHEFSVTVQAEGEVYSENNLPLVDEETRQKLARAGIIHNTKSSSLHALKTIDDGLEPADVIAMSMWGTPDKLFFLRGLQFLTVTNCVIGSFKHRFCYNWLKSPSTSGNGKPKLQDMDAVWKNVEQFIKGVRPSSRGDCIFFAFSFFVLANIIKRPIIVKSGEEEKSFAGIYLPLERKISDCNKTPVFVGLHDGRLYPLVFGNSGINVIPVHYFSQKSDTNFVKFMSAQEESLSQVLLNHYLNVVTDISGRTCLKFENRPLPYQWYTPKCRILFNSDHKPTKVTDVYVTSEHNQNAVKMNKESQLHANKRNEETTLLVRGKGNWTRFVDSKSSDKHYEADGTGKGLQDRPTYTVPIKTSFNSNQRPTTRLQFGSKSLRQFGSKSLEEKGTDPFPLPHEVCSPEISSNERKYEENRNIMSARRNSFIRAKSWPEETGNGNCVTRSCEMFGSPETGGMCSVCFKKYTVRMSGPLVHDGNLRAVGLQQNEPPTSMMDVKCRNNCGLICSIHTFPYCHECLASNMNGATLIHF